MKYPKTYKALIKNYSDSLDDDQIAVEMCFDTTPDWVKQIYEKEISNVSKKWPGSPLGLKKATFEGITYYPEVKKKSVKVRSNKKVRSKVFSKAKGKVKRKMFQMSKSKQERRSKPLLLKKVSRNKMGRR